MNQREDLILELNQLLKGTHMGAFVFEDLLEKLNEAGLKQEFQHFLSLLKGHEVMLTRHIQELNGEPVDSSGLKGTIADMMTMIKNMVIATDTEVIQEAKKAIEMGKKALQDFDDRHFTLSETLTKEIAMMKDDYDCIYHTLHKFLIAREG